MPPDRELSYAEVATRTSRSALRVPHRGSSARLPIDPETGEDLPRTFLPHAIEFDLATLNALNTTSRSFTASTATESSRYASCPGAGPARLRAGDRPDRGA